MYLSEDLQNKWGEVLDHPDLPKIDSPHKRAVVAQLLENQETEARTGASGGQTTPTLLGEAAPTNAVVDAAGGGQMDMYDPVMIALIRRSAPNLIAYDICGVQPMTGPSGLIFAMRSQYAANTAGTGTAAASEEYKRLEAFYNESDTKFSASANNAIGGAAQGSLLGTGSTAGADPTDRGSAYGVRQGMSTAQAEALGDADNNHFTEMGFSVEKVTVTAKSRAMKAEYTMELAQDLKAIHGLDAEQELSNILSTEITSENNREIVRTVNIIAVAGATENTAVSGQFDLDIDSNGRWAVEKFKGLMFQLEREANKISQQTRRGRGNVLICSSDVASALSMAGMLDYTPALKDNLNVDDTGNTFVGVLNGRYRVYIDPYFTSSSGLQYMTMGFKGGNPYDAGLFYCPYVPLQMVRAIGENTFQPKIGFKTRYGMVANPFAEGTTRGAGALTAGANKYYRFVAVKNLM